MKSKTAGLIMMAGMLVPLMHTAAAGTYRWVDEQGRIHYGDQVPPEEVNKGYTVINKQGMRVDNVAPAKTPEELAEEQRQAELEAERQRVAREKALRDRLLVETFRSEQDLLEARDSNITMVEGFINLAQHKIENLQKNLETLTRSAANLERGGKPVLEDLREDIADHERQLAEQREFVASQRAQQEELRRKYAADLERYRELKGLDKKADDTGEPTGR